LGVLVSQIGVRCLVVVLAEARTKLLHLLDLRLNLREKLLDHRLLLRLHGRCRQSQLRQLRLDSVQLLCLGIELAACPLELVLEPLHLPATSLRAGCFWWV
jgi:hypothetical protein